VKVREFKEKNSDRERNEYENEQKEERTSEALRRKYK